MNIFERVDFPQCLLPELRKTAWLLWPWLVVPSTDRLWFTAPIAKSDGSADVDPYRAQLRRWPRPNGNPGSWKLRIFKGSAELLQCDLGPCDYPPLVQATAQLAESFALVPLSVAQARGLRKVAKKERAKIAAARPPRPPVLRPPPRMVPVPEGWHITTALGQRRWLCAKDGRLWILRRRKEKRRWYIRCFTANVPCVQRPQGPGLPEVPEDVWEALRLAVSGTSVRCNCPIGPFGDERQHVKHCDDMHRLLPLSWYVPSGYDAATWANAELTDVSIELQPDRLLVSTRRSLRFLDFEFFNGFEAALNAALGALT